MKKTLLFLAVSFLTVSTVQANPISADCTLNGKRLAGKVQIVKNFPDFKVKIVDTFQDLKVKKMRNFARKCGEWQFVSNFPDIKIQFVKHFPDFTVKYVDYHPGL